MKVYNDLLEYNESKNLYEKMEGYPELSERYVKPIKWDFKTLSCEMEKVGESISNRLTLKKPLEGEGEMFYLDDYFDSVVSWLKETLEMLHNKDLYHGDILGEGNFHIGNIVCELDDGIWKYKLIDFGDKLGETENSYITFGVDSNREVREMSGKQKEEILLRKLFTDEGKYTVELNFFKNKIEMEENVEKIETIKHYYTQVSVDVTTMLK